MKHSVTKLDVAYFIANCGNHILNVIIGLCLILALLYGGFGLYDTYKIYQGASISSDLLKYKPKEDGGDSSLTLSDLKAINSDVFGWLVVDGTSIDYPTVRGSDNVIYLNRDVTGEFSLSGSIFLDYRNNTDMLDSYSLFYGHHMEGNAMFGEIPKFLEDDFFNKNMTGTLYLEDRTLNIEWFACIYTDAYDDYAFSPLVGENGSQMLNVVSYLRDNADQYRDLSITGDNRIIGLSTCHDATTNGRILLFGLIK